MNNADRQLIRDYMEAVAALEEVWDHPRLRHETWQKAEVARKRLHERFPPNTEPLDP